MKTGVAIAFNHLTTPEFMAGAGRLIEERGFESAWAPEHVVFFPQYDSRYPYSEDGRIPGDPIGVLEPFTALTWLAAHTKRLRLGTGICLVPQRQPVYVARQAADVDYLSGGRLELGVGIGWLKEEFDALGVPFAERAARTEECIALMRSMWCDEISEFQGRFYTLAPCYANPKPVQKPHPPIIFGGESDAALSRVARLGDGWYGFNLSLERLTERLGVLERMLAEAGRSRSDIVVYVNPERGAMTPELPAQLADLGVDQIIAPLGARDLDTLARRADRLAATAG